MLQGLMSLVCLIHGNIRGENIYRFIYIVACIPSISLVDGKSDGKVWRIHFAILR